jgi:prepilin peptidase CpaA
MFELIAVAAFAGLLVYAAACDVASLTIPNWLSAALAGAFVLAALLLGAPLGEVALHLLFGVAVLAVGFFLFQANIIGGGDAKLLAAAATWTGVTAVGPLLFWTAIAGGLMALALLGARQFVRQTETHPAFVNRLLTKQAGIPYGVAIMFGALMAVPSLPLFSATLTTP